MNINSTSSKGTPAASKSAIAYTLIIALLVTVVAASPIAVPPILDPSSVPTWAIDRRLEGAVMGTVRLLSLCLFAYLAIMTALGTLARITKLRRVVCLTDVFSIAPLRRLLDTYIGIGLSVATATSAIAVPVATGPKLIRVDNQAPVLRPLAPLPGDRPEPSPTSAPPQLARPAVAVTFGRLPATPADNTTPVTGAAHPAFSSVASPAEADAHADDTWVVEPGDHLWSIAEAVTRRRQHGPVTQAMISRYWRAMITANRTSIVDPDVIQPGDRVQLPPNTLDR